MTDIKSNPGSGIAKNHGASDQLGSVVDSSTLASAPSVTGVKDSRVGSSISQVDDFGAAVAGTVLGQPTGTSQKGLVPPNGSAGVAARATVPTRGAQSATSDAAGLPATAVAIVGDRAIYDVDLGKLAVGQETSVDNGGQRDAALVALVDVYSLEAEARQKGISFTSLGPDGEGFTLANLDDQRWSLFDQLVASEVEAGQDPTVARATVDDRLAADFERAMWAPHLGQIDAALGDMDAASRDAVLRHLVDLYFPAFGADAFAEVGRGLAPSRPESPVARLVAVIRAAGTLSLSVAALDAVVSRGGVAGEFAAVLLRDVNVRDPIGSGATPVVPIVYADGRVGAQVSEPIENPIIAGLQRGELRVQLNSGTGELSLQGDEDSPAPSSDLAAATLNQLAVRLDDAAADVAGVSTVSVSTLVEVLHANGVVEIAGSEDAAMALALGSGVGRELHKLVLRHVVSSEAAGSSVVDGTRRSSLLSGWDLPLAYQAELQEFSDRVALLRRAQPFSREVVAALAGEEFEPVKISLNPQSEHFSPRQRNLLATVQRLMVGLGALDEDQVRYGYLSESTAAELGKLATPDNRSELTIDDELLRSIVGAAAALYPAQKQLLGDIVAEHPALLRHRENGGDAVALRLMQTYLNEVGYQPQSPDGWAEALLESSGFPVDTEALARAAVLAAGQQPPSGGDWLADDSLLHSVLSSDQHKSRAVVSKTATALDVAQFAQRMAQRTRPFAVRELSASELGMLPIYEPIVALKLLRSRLADAPLPVDAEGYVDGELSAGDFAFLRRARFAALGSVEPSTVAAWDAVQKAIDNGDLVISSLVADDLLAKDDSTLRQPLALVLGDLGQMVETVRMATLPTDRAQVRVAQQQEAFAPLSTFARPLDVARQVLGSWATTGAAATPTVGSAPVSFGAPELKELHALEQFLAGESVEARIPKDGADRFLKAHASRRAELLLVTQAVTEGRLQIGENAITATPRDAALEAAAAQVRALILQGAEVLQSRRRHHNAGFVGGLERAAISAASYFGVLPGFADAVVFNNVQDWMVAALKIDISRTLQTTTANAAKPRLGAELMEIDAAAIEHVIAKHEGALGSSVFETVSTGILPGVPSSDAAVELLRELAKEMKTAKRAPWSSLNVTLADVDERGRTGKALMQLALGRIYGGGEDWFGDGLSAREGAAVKGLVERLVGMEPHHQAQMLKGFLVQIGRLDVAAAGAVGDDWLGKEAIRAAVDLAEAGADSYADVAADVSLELEKSIDVLREFLESDKSDAPGMHLDPAVISSAERQALGSVTRYVVSVMGSVGEMGVFDFRAMLAPVGGDIKVRHHRGVPGKAAAAAAAAAAATDGALTLSQFELLGRRDSWSDEQAKLLSDWAERSHFSADRAMQSAGANYVLFKHMMHTMIGYDLWVSPFVKSGRALSEWKTAVSDSQRDEALASLGGTWSDWVDLQVMFTAFRTPIGFGQDLWSEVERGELDVAVGKGAVFVPMMLASTRGMVAMARSLGRRFMPAPAAGTSSGGGPQVVGSIKTGRSGANQGAGVVRQAVAFGYRGVGAVGDTLWKPGAAIKEGIGALRRGINALAGKPRASIPAGWPALTTLASPAEAAKSRLWEVKTEAGTSRLTLRNSDVVALVRQVHTKPALFEKTLRTLGLQEHRAAIRSIAGGYSSVSPAALRGADRAAFAYDTASRARAATARALGGAAALQGGPAGDGRQVVLPDRVKLALESLRGRFSGAKSGMSFDVVRGAVSDLRGAARSPGFYLVVGGVAAQEFLVDLGQTLNDDSLTTMERVSNTLSSAAIATGKTAAALGVFAALGRAAPRVAKVAGRGLGALLLQDVELLVNEVVDSFAGISNPLDAMRYWRAIGIPEAGYFKIDPERYDTTWLGYDAGNDIETLTDGVANQPTLRTSHWYFDDQSPLHARLRQLAGLGPDDPTPIRKPKEFNSDNVRSYVEPVYPSVDFLNGLNDLRAIGDFPSLTEHPRSRDFDFAAWQKAVGDAAVQVVLRVDVSGDGEESSDISKTVSRLMVDELALAELLTAQDDFHELNPTQRESLQRRVAIEVEQATRWVGLLNSFSISDAEKEAAILQLVENLAANHYVNSLMFAVVPTENARLSAGRSFGFRQYRTPAGDDGIDDYYTVAPALVRQGR